MAKRIVQDGLVNNGDYWKARCEEEAKKAQANLKLAIERGEQLAAARMCLYTLMERERQAAPEENEKNLIQAAGRLEQLTALKVHAESLEQELAYCRLERDTLREKACFLVDQLCQFHGFNRDMALIQDIALWLKETASEGKAV